MKNTYWNKKGKYQKELDEIKGLIPDEGESNIPHVELLRNVTNLYYDHYNNGDCNWDSNEAQFGNIQSNTEVLHKYAVLENATPFRFFLGFMEKDLYKIFNSEIEGSMLNKSFEKLADIIVKYAWETEQVVLKSKI